MLALGGDFTAAMAALFSQLTTATSLREGLLAIFDREHETLVADEQVGSAANLKEPAMAKKGEGLLGRIDRMAAASKLSRSGFLAEAARRLLRERAEGS